MLVHRGKAHAGCRACTHQKTSLPNRPRDTRRPDPLPRSISADWCVPLSQSDRLRMVAQLLRVFFVFLVLIEAPVQRSRTNPENLSGLFAIVVGHLQRFLNRPTLDDAQLLTDQFV